MLIGRVICGVSDGASSCWFPQLSQGSSLPGCMSTSAAAAAVVNHVLVVCISVGATSCLQGQPAVLGPGISSTYPVDVVVKVWDCPVAAQCVGCDTQQPI
jgi:hypothetical protein